MQTVQTQGTMYLHLNIYWLLNYRLLNYRFLNYRSLNYRLLNLYCEIFGINSYGEGRTSLHNIIFHNINSITFLLYTFTLIFYFHSYSLHKKSKCYIGISIEKMHYICNCIMPYGAKMTFGI